MRLRIRHGRATLRSATYTPKVGWYVRSMKGKKPYYGPFVSEGDAYFAGCCAWMPPKLADQSKFFSVNHWDQQEDLDMILKDPEWAEENYGSAFQWKRPGSLPVAKSLKDRGVRSFVDAAQKVKTLKPDTEHAQEAIEKARGHYAKRDSGPEGANAYEAVVNLYMALKS